MIRVLMLSFLVMLHASASKIDCSDNLSQAEAVICDNQYLHDLDEEMSNLYAKVKKLNKSIVGEQKAWIKARNQCATTECFESSYKNRITELSEALNYAKGKNTNTIKAEATASADSTKKEGATEADKKSNFSWSTILLLLLLFVGIPWWIFDSVFVGKKCPKCTKWRAMKETERTLKDTSLGKTIEGKTQLVKLYDIEYTCKYCGYTKRESETKKETAS